MIFKLIFLNLLADSSVSSLIDSIEFVLIVRTIEISDSEAWVFDIKFTNSTVFDFVFTNDINSFKSSILIPSTNNLKVFELLFLLKLINLLFEIIVINASIEPIIPAVNWSEPKVRPIAIDKNIYASSSGSFIGDLKRTIDNAPTSPNDNAKDDLTTEIIIVVVTDSRGKMFAKESWFDNVFPYLLKIKPSIVDEK